MTSRGPSKGLPSSERVVSTTEAFLSGWLLCGVLDISAALVLSWVEVGRTPGDVLRGIASALWGRGALTGGTPMAFIGLAMHFTVALTATAIFLLLSRRFAELRTAPLMLVGPVYGAAVFFAMNDGVLPALSWLRSLYLGTAPYWPGPMTWPLLLIHLVCVGTPIAWGVRRAG